MHWDTAMRMTDIQRQPNSEQSQIGVGQEKGLSAHTLNCKHGAERASGKGKGLNTRVKFFSNMLPQIMLPPSPAPNSSPTEKQVLKYMSLWGPPVQIIT